MKGTFRSNLLWNGSFDFGGGRQHFPSKDYR